MQFIQFATFLNIGAVMAKSKPVLRHHQNDALRYKDLASEADCDEYFTALDADNSGDITMEDIDAISTRPDAAHLMDVFFATLFATGVTNIQDAFSINQETFVLYCSEAYYDDMTSAVAKRVEFFAAMKHKHNINLQASCRMACPEGHYCGSGECRPNGSCATVNDCLISENIFPVAGCVGTMQCNDGQCGMDCTDTPPDPTLPAPPPDPTLPAEAKTVEKRAALKEKLVIHMHSNNNNDQLQTPSCYAECPEGVYCGSGGCTANGSCGTLEDCSNPDNLYAAAACAGTLECNAGTCAMKCGESPPDPTLPAPAQIENRAALKEKLAIHISNNNKPQTTEVQQEHTKNLSHHKQPTQLSATTCEDFLDYWYSTYFFEPYCEECLEGGCVFANGRCANECMADASCFTSYCPMPDDCHSCLDRGYVWTAGECSEHCMADASCYTSIVDCP